MTRNRVRQLADQRGWTAVDLFRESILKQVVIGQSTIERLYAEPNYMASIKSLEALAKVFGVAVTELIEDVPDQGSK